MVSLPFGVKNLVLKGERPRHLNLPHQFEASAEFRDEQFRLFERGKVAAFVEFVPVNNIGVGLFRPGAWGGNNFFGKDTASSR